jgi:Xaa-Pro aminopeptidase/Xaa-Pro dipeptidase
MNHASRLASLRARLAHEGLDAITVSSAENQRYLCGYTGHAAALFVGAERAWLITDYRYAGIAEATVHGAQVVVRDRLKQTLAERLLECAAEIEAETVGIEAQHLSHAAALALPDALRWTPTTGIVEAQRYRKDVEEIAAIERAAAIADTALAGLLAGPLVGRSERDLARELEARTFDGGAEGMAFETIVLSGPRSALPHGTPSTRVLERGELLLIDFGAVVNGYRSDMTRTHVVGAASKRQREVYELVLRAQTAGIEALEHGARGDHVAAASTAVLASSELARFAGEGLGHGVGLGLHESPLMGFGGAETLESGCVVTVEPGIYIPDWGGVRIEDDVVIEGAGVRRLTRSPNGLELPNHAP